MRTVSASLIRLPPGGGLAGQPSYIIGPRSAVLREQTDCSLIPYRQQAANWAYCARAPGGRYESPACSVEACLGLRAEAPTGTSKIVWRSSSSPEASLRS